MKLVLVGKTIKIETMCGTIYVTLNKNNNIPYQTLIRLGKTGNCLSAQMEAIANLISLLLQNGVDIEEIIKRLSNIRCDKPRLTSNGTITSCADAIAKGLKELVE